MFFMFFICKSMFLSSMPKTYIKTPNSFNFVAMATRVGSLKI